ncbi:MAG TPA: nicotinamide riboside transporter PnuC [Perlabentimonas sp.]|nr:nicotinamide riboside transporter PnuC [Bacteroidales bacterium]MDD4673071.1 nicotinamide riboside transporter PnuC [Bacteroidales bacterium]MDY0349305.1 nicotinamide riboside transporter PnuC [Tenuifilaceae bacterium]HZJ73445.1 nicotinamide riboside transporter PnuC [Perlabentimonas sp.]
MLSWLQGHYIEVIGAVTGVIYLFLEIKQKIWLWPFGFITSAFYVYIFFTSKFYADMSLQFYYLGVSLYGWWNWHYGGNRESSNSLPVTRIKPKLTLKLSLFTLTVFAILVFVLKEFTDSPVPIGDAFTTALSITATWMLAKKLLEMWWLWVVANLVSLILYIYKGLYPTSILFLFNFTMSIVGYVQWKKSMLQAQGELREPQLP